MVKCNNLKGTMKKIAVALSIVLVGSSLYGMQKVKEADSRLLFDAVISNDCSKLLSLVARGADINTVNNRKSSLLYCTVAFGLSDTMVEFLLAHGADPFLQNIEDETPLHCAAEWGNSNHAELLLKALVYNKLKLLIDEPEETVPTAPSLMGSLWQTLYPSSTVPQVVLSDEQRALGKSAGLANFSRLFVDLLALLSTTMKPNELCSLISESVTDEVVRFCSLTDTQGRTAATLARTTDRKLHELIDPDQVPQMLPQLIRKWLLEAQQVIDQYDIVKLYLKDPKAFRKKRGHLPQQVSRMLGSLICKELIPEVLVTCLPMQLYDWSGMEAAYITGDGAKVISLSGAGSAKMWDARNGTLIKELYCDDQPIEHARLSAFNNAGDCLALVDDADVLVMDCNSGDLVFTNKGVGEVLQVAFTRKGDKLLTVCPSLLQLWNRQGECVASLEGKYDWVNAVGIDPEGKMLVLATDETCFLQSVDGLQKRELQGHSQRVTYTEFDPSGTHLITGSEDGSAKLWHKNGSCRVTFNGHTASVLVARFNEQGTYIATGSADGAAKIWDTEGRCLATLTHDTALDTDGSGITYLEFNQTGDRILTLGSNGDVSQVKVWDVSGKHLATLSHKHIISSAHFDRTGKKVVTSSQDGTVRLWQLVDLQPKQGFTFEQGLLIRSIYEISRYNNRAAKEPITLDVDLAFPHLDEIYVLLPEPLQLLLSPYMRLPGGGRATGLIHNDEIGIALHNAVSRNNVKQVKWLLQNNEQVPVSLRDHRGVTPLVKAVRNRNLKLVELLLDHGAEPITPFEREEESALYWATRQKGESIILDNSILGCLLTRRVVPLLRRDDRWSLEKRLTYGLSQDSCDKHGATLVMRASFHGAVRCVKLLIEKGADLQAVNGQGETVLHLACRGGHREIVRLLKKNGARDVKDKSGNFPFDVAYQEGHEELCQDFERCKEAGRALRMALRTNALDDVERQLSECTDINQQDQFGCTLLYRAAQWGRTGPVSLFLAQGALPDVQDETGRTAFHRAAAAGHLAVVQLLFANGASTDLRDTTGSTPLHYADANGHTAVASFLLDQGADINAVDEQGRTILHNAVLRGATGTVEQYLRRNADISIRDGQGMMPCHYAVQQEQRLPLLAKMLTLCALDPQKYADLLSLPDSEGRTLLHYAAMRGDMDLLKLIVDACSDIHGQDASGNTPLMLALKQGSLEVARLLIEHGANINTQDALGRTPLCRAVQQKDVPMVTCLLSNDADVEVGDNKGWTPLHHAAKNDLQEIASLLLDNGADPMCTTLPTDSSGRFNVLQVAVRHKSEKVIQLLEGFQECSICLELMQQQGEDVVRVACGHAFHDGCFKRLLGSASLKCPVCRAAMKCVLCSKGINPGISMETYSACRHLVHGDCFNNAEKADQCGHCKAKKDGTAVPLDYQKIHEDLKQGDLTLLRAALRRDDFDPNTIFTSRNDSDGFGNRLVIRSTTLFIQAAAFGNVEAMKLLKEAGADIYAATQEGWTALHAAATHNRVEAARYLLRITADRPAFVQRGDNQTGATAARAAGYFRSRDVQRVFRDNANNR